MQMKENECQDSGRFVTLLRRLPLVADLGSSVLVCSLTGAFPAFTSFTGVELDTSLFFCLRVPSYIS